MLVREKLGRPSPRIMVYSCMSHVGIGWYFSSSLTGVLLLNGIFSPEVRHSDSCIRRVKNMKKRTQNL